MTPAKAGPASIKNAMPALTILADKSGLGVERV